MLLRHGVPATCISGTTGSRPVRRAKSSAVPMRNQPDPCRKNWCASHVASRFVRLPSNAQRCGDLTVNRGGVAVSHDRLVAVPNHFLGDGSNEVDDPQRCNAVLLHQRHRCEGGLVQPQRLLWSVEWLLRCSGPQLLRSGCSDVLCSCCSFLLQQRLRLGLLPEASLRLRQLVP